MKQATLPRTRRTRGRWCHGCSVTASWAFWNRDECLPHGSKVARGDGMGMKLGPHASNKDLSKTLLKVLTNNLAFENRTAGFDQNGGRVLFRLHNNVAFGNGSTGFIFGYFPEVVNDIHNNVGFRNPAEEFSGTNRGTFNTWNRNQPVAASDF